MDVLTEGLDSQEQIAVAPLDATDYHLVLDKWNDTQADYPKDTCIHQLFERQVERTPNAVAVTFEDQHLTYQQLNQQANQLAYHLRTLGVGSEVLVGICVERSLEMIVGLLGILKANGAYVPLNPDNPSDRLAFILKETRPLVILTQAYLLGSLPVTRETVVCLDSDWEAVARNRHDNPGCMATADNLMYVIHTSGSTGQPKGVMITHSAIYNQLFWRQTTFPLTQADRILQNISFSFDPSVWQIFWALSFGAQLVLPRPGGHQDSNYLVKLIAQEQITVIALVPSMLRVLLEEKELNHCSCLRHVFCGGEVLPIALQEQFYTRLTSNTALHNVYGPTEAAIDATCWTCKPATQCQVAPIGRPIANTQIYILNSALQPVAVGEPGELHIGGAGLARGYLNHPELTAKKFIANPFVRKLREGEAKTGTLSLVSRLYKTGDLTRYLPDGNIEFLGRIDDQVKIRGFRIELGEIEVALTQHPSIQQSVLVAREDSPGDKRLVAYVILVQGQNLVINELRQFLKAKLPEYMIPAAFMMLETLPLNSNGKVNRQALPVPSQERPISDNAFVAPQTSVELELTKIWTQVLRIQAISVEDNFFDLGGNSLLAASVLTQIEAKFNKKLPLNTFLQAPTLKQQAWTLQENQWDTSYSSIVAIQPNGSRPPLFCVHASNGNVLQFYKLAHYLADNQPFYGIQAQGLDDGQPLHKSVAEMAAAYIEEIQAFQPSGPYFLSGYSFGGLVAYEMARQLQDQGQQVAMLFLLDTYNIRGDWFRALSRGGRFFNYVEQFSRLEWQKKLTYLQAVLQQELQAKLTQLRVNLADRPQPDEKPVAPAQEPSVETMCEAAAIEYRPQAYPNQAILMRATQSADWLKPVKINTDLGWQPLVKELEIQEISCHHFNLLLEPNVKVLAGKLQASLDAAQAGSLSSVL